MNAEKTLQLNSSCSVLCLGHFDLFIVLCFMNHWFLRYFCQVLYSSSVVSNCYLKLDVRHRVARKDAEEKERKFLVKVNSSLGSAAWNGASTLQLVFVSETC